jgi:hypothetical protein
MCIDKTEPNTELRFGSIEEVTMYIDNLGDLFIIPCQQRIRALTPTWNEYHLTSDHVYAVVKEDEIERTLNDLGFPHSGREWLEAGHSVKFTCWAISMLDDYLFCYNGIEY